MKRVVRLVELAIVFGLCGGAYAEITIDARKMGSEHAWQDEYVIIKCYSEESTPQVSGVIVCLGAPTQANQFKDLSGKTLCDTGSQIGWETGIRRIGQSGRPVRCVTAEAYDRGKTFQQQIGRRVEDFDIENFRRFTAGH